MPETRGDQVVVIGGGPAGYAAAIRAAQHDLDVTLVEDEGLGGTCLNHGCIPSKALISATDLAHRAGDARSMGISADPAVDVERMIRWKDGIVRRLTKGVAHLCDKRGVRVIDGVGRFADEETVVVERADGEETTVEFDYAIVATGSRPVEIPSLPFTHDRILDSRAALAIDETPDSMAIVGAGYIGMELAGVFAKLGTDVTVIELLEKTLPRYPERLTTPVTDRAERLGVEFEFETAVEGMSDAEDGIILETDAESIAVDRALVAVGRAAVTDTAGLDAIGIERADDGTVPTDAHGRTELDHVFAVGDVAGEPMLAHAGIAEGMTAAATIADVPARTDRHIPEVVFTDPEIARVGDSASALREAGVEPQVGEFPLRANGRSLTLDRRDGFVRLVAEADSGRIRGGAIVGPEASELIGELGLAVELEATLSDVAETVHSHPTLSEAIMEAAEHGLGLPIHRLD